jgi:hypothetical protein
MRLGDPQRKPEPPPAHPPATEGPSSRHGQQVRAGTGAHGDPNGDPDGGGDDDDDDDGFRRGATARSAGVGASRRLPLLLLPLPPLLRCPGMRVRATLTATKRRGLPAGSAAKATCLESLLAQPPLASLPAGGTAHYPRTTHYALHRTAHCLVGRFSASWSRRPKSSSRRWRCWRRWRRWSRSPCHGGRAGVTYSRAAASWAMLDHCWTMPGAVVNPVPAAQTVQARWLATGW